MSIIAGWCRQAKERGALTGDLCSVQSIAASIVYLSESMRQRDALGVIIDRMDDIFDAWSTLEHPDFYRFRQEEKARAAMDDGWEDVSMESLSAGSMGEMIEKMRGIASGVSDVAEPSVGN